jgi:hypothetical protein
VRIVRFHNSREAAVPKSWDEGFDMLVQTMNAYQDRRGGNLARQSAAARVAYGLFGERFMAADPTDAIVFLVQEICRRKGAGLDGLEKLRRWHSAEEEETQT